MDKNDHLEALKSHYIEEIHEALKESEHEHGTIVDYNKLNDMILFSWKAPTSKGLI